MRKEFDTLVVGAGPAGIAAAVSAADDGQCVGLADDNPAPGGQIWRTGANLPDEARSWLARLDAASVVRLQGWRVFDCPQQHVLRAEQNGAKAAANGDRDCIDVRYGKLVLATGARERFLPFPGWTLPNVMGAGGLDAMVRGGLPIGGKRVVIAGTGPLLLAVAAHLAKRGAKIQAVCEQATTLQLAVTAARMWSDSAKLWQGAFYRAAFRKSHFYTGCWPVLARGKGQLEAVTLRQGRKEWDVDCDYLACGFHLIPNTELPALLGCHIEHGFVTTNAILETSVAGVYCAGEPTGIGGVELSLLEGQIAGLAVSGRVDEAKRVVRRRHRMLSFVRTLRRGYALNTELRGLASEETIVCRCEDVPYGALREHSGWREAKLQTRCGMGPCQGRICGPAAEFLFGWTADSVRPPIFPVLVSSLGSAEGQEHPSKTNILND